MASVLAGGSEAAAAPVEDSAKRTCRGPAALANSLGLPGARKVSIRRVRCRDAGAVVKRFAARCVTAYSSQGSCRVKARRRWRCSSRIAGPVSRGVPSSVRCSSRRSRVGFTIAISSAELADVARAPVAHAAIEGPYQADQQCIDAAASAQLVPPRDPDNSFELRTWGAVPPLFGRAAQARMVNRGVGRRLIQGLTTRPRNSPQRAPLFLITGEQEGVTSRFCDGSNNDAAVAAIGVNLAEAAKVSAHELFHVFARGVKFTPGYYPWFEDVAAEWSVWRAGLMPPGGTSFEAALQFPHTALDTRQPEFFRYGMWRFLQFLDDKDMVEGSGGSWPLVRSVVAGQPDAFGALNRALTARGTSLGEELAAFWGEHLKAKPKRPPRLVPTPNKNAREVEVTAGRDTVSIPADSMRTRMFDFKLARDVNRVEFEFEPLPSTYFWGLTAPNTSERFQAGDSVSFCLGKDNADDIEWPGNFPVTFTNGTTGDNSLRGEIHVYAQTDADQCKHATGNKACRVLRQTRAQGLLGPAVPNIGGFRGRDLRGGPRPSGFCRYLGLGGLGYLSIERWRSSKALRRWITTRAKKAGWRRIHAGDVSYILEVGDHAFLTVAVGRIRLAIEVSSNRGSTSVALRIAEDAIPLVR